MLEGLLAIQEIEPPYFDALKLLISDCPETEEATFAASLLAQLGVDLGFVGEISQPDKTEEESAFIFNSNKEHYFAIIYSCRKRNGE